MHAKRITFHSGDSEMATPSNGFKVTDKDGMLLAHYGHQSEVKTYLLSSFGDKAHTLRRSDAVNGMELIGDEGEVLARVIGDWKDE